MMTLFFVFLSGIFKRWYKVGLFSAMIDSLALSGKCTSGPRKSKIFLVYILFWMLFSIRFRSQGIWLLWTKCRVNHNAQYTSSPCSRFRDLLLFQSPLHQISPSKVSECALQDSIVLLKGANTALKGGCFVLKALVATSESLYYYLTGILCIITPCHWLQTHTIHLVPMCQEKISLSQITGLKRHFKESFWPGVQPTLYTVGLIDMWHHRLFIFLSLRLGC